LLCLFFGSALERTCFFFFRVTSGGGIPGKTPLPPLFQTESPSAICPWRWDKDWTDPRSFTQLTFWMYSTARILLFTFGGDPLHVSAILFGAAVLCETKTCTAVSSRSDLQWRRGLNQRSHLTVFFVCGEAAQLWVQVSFRLLGFWVRFACLPSPRRDPFFVGSAPQKL